MVTRQQNLRHFAPFPGVGPRIVRILQQSAFETLLVQSLRRTDDAWQQTHTGIDQGDSRRFSARQHEVTDRDLPPSPAPRSPARPTALETAPDDGEAAKPGQFLTRACVSGAPARGQVDQRFVLPFTGRSIDSCGQNVGPHHHARPAAEGAVVNRAVFITRKIATVSTVSSAHRPDSRPCRQRGTERGPGTSPETGSAPFAAQVFCGFSAIIQQANGRIGDQFSARQIDFRHGLAGKGNDHGLVGASGRTSKRRRRHGRGPR